MSAATGPVITAALFDLDGTLVDSEPLIAQAIQRMLAGHGHEVTFEQVVAALGPPLDGMIETLTGGTVDAATFAAMRREYLDHYDETIDQVPALPGAIEMLDRLQDAGVAVAVVTNKHEDSATSQLTAIGWTDRFPVMIGADTTGHAKPAPDPAIEALRRLDRPAAQAAFIGDTDTDMQCAAAAGIPIRIGITHVRPPEVLRAGGATHLCATLAEVQQILLGG